METHKKNATLELRTLVLDYEWHTRKCLPKGLTLGPHLLVVPWGPQPSYQSAMQMASDPAEGVSLLDILEGHPSGQVLG